MIRQALLSLLCLQSDKHDYLSFLKDANCNVHPSSKQSRSQGLSSYRPLERARRDPGTCWPCATLTFENIREEFSVIRQLVTLSFVEYQSMAHTVLQLTLSAMFNSILGLQDEISNNIYSNVYNNYIIIITLFKCQCI